MVITWSVAMLVLSLCLSVGEEQERRDETRREREEKREREKKKTHKLTQRAMSHGRHMLCPESETLNHTPSHTHTHTHTQVSEHGAAPVGL